MTVYFQLRMDLQNKNDHAQDDELFYNWLRPILFDFCPAYGYQCCWILTMLHPAIKIHGDFWSILLHRFCLDYIVTTVPYLITTR
jgi:hypothetical protein